MPEHCTILRARNSEESQILYKSAEELSYNPIFSKSRKGRLNAQGESRFYGCIDESSNSFGTALSEVDCNTGDHACILISKTKKKLQLTPIGIFDFIRREGSPPWGLSNHYQEIYEELRKHLKPQSMISMQLCDAFLSHTLKMPVSEEENNLYEVTIAIAKVILNDTELQMIDGIIYPSSKFERFPNIVLKKESVDTKLTYQSTVAVQVIQNYGYGIFRTQPTHRGTIDSQNNIQWEDI